MATSAVANAAQDTTAEHVERIDCGEVVLDCIVAGDDARPLVVLLHGFPESRHSWRHQIGPLSEHYRVVAPDLRGYGKSDRPRGVAAYRLDRLVADVRGLVRAMRRERAHIVGHDWGGAIAWALAIDDDRRTNPDGTARSAIAPVVDKLVVMNCPHPVRFERALRLNPVQQLRSAYFGFFMLPIVPEMLLAAADFSLLRGLTEFGLGGRTMDEVFGRDYDERLRDTLGSADGLTAAINYYRAAMLNADDLRARYGGDARISRPTLLIWGEDDSALDLDLTRGMDSYFAGQFRLEIIPRVSHWVQQEAPAAVEKLLLEFLADGVRT